MATWVARGGGFPEGGRWLGRCGSEEIDKFLLECAVKEHWLSSVPEFPWCVCVSDLCVDSRPTHPTQPPTATPPWGPAFALGH